ncbi:MAG: hypothetical protein WCS88_03840 [Patescibacteria group bacterium]|jgi:hypothetical protein
MKKSQNGSGTSKTKQSAARWRRVVESRRHHNPARKSRIASAPVRITDNEHRARVAGLVAEFMSITAKETT